jgi:hypothetical protein
MRLDLHLHTTASDGSWPPEAVVRQARAGGLDVIAITDHDTTAGLDAAATAARASGMRLVPGCELSSTHEGRDVHVLGYGVDPDADALRRYEARAGDRRRARMAEMVERLGSLGVVVSLERVLELASEEGVVGRPHLARALVEAGHARELPEAFDRLIGDGQPAFVPTALHTPADVIEVIGAAGGVAVWAHPPADLLDPLLPSLVGAGLRGIEAYRPGHSPRRTRRILDRAAQAGLVVSGGSDWHDPERNHALGVFHVLERQVEGLLGLLPSAR